MKLGKPTCRFCPHFVANDKSRQSALGVCTKYPPIDKYRPLLPSTDSCSKFSEWKHPEIKIMQYIEYERYAAQMRENVFGCGNELQNHEVHKLDRFIC